MLTLTLQRTSKEGKAIRGSIILPFSQRPTDPELEDKDYTVQTLENADYLIPAGTYPFKRSYSPKFKKILPIIEDVPDRTGIRVHMGTKPEHSTGCVLTDFAGMAYINTMFNRLIALYDEEEMSICVIDDFGD